MLRDAVHAPVTEVLHLSTLAEGKNFDEKTMPSPLCRSRGIRRR
ncbi:MAG: hypothetical protein RML36_11800 [Anaerolineae bacterium]|nr:hypothetical protein [Anaerolineae bacterium]MDW8100152.1 hypothetical protein [Anaerolineae bacterium]